MNLAGGLVAPLLDAGTIVLDFEFPITAILFLRQHRHQILRPGKDKGILFLAVVTGKPLLGLAADRRD